MINKRMLAAAARALDEQAEQGVELPDALELLDIDSRSAIFVAFQRALRVALLFDGWSEEELSMLSRLRDTPTDVPPGLSPEQKALIPVYASLWMDGAAIAAKAVKDSAGS